MLIISIIIIIITSIIMLVGNRMKFPGNVEVFRRF